MLACFAHLDLVRLQGLAQAAQALVSNAQYYTWVCSLLCGRHCTPHDSTKMIVDVKICWMAAVCHSSRVLQTLLVRCIRLAQRSWHILTPV